MEMKQQQALSKMASGYRDARDRSDANPLGAARKGPWFGALRLTVRRSGALGCLLERPERAVGVTRARHRDRQMCGHVAQLEELNLRGA